MNGVGDRPEDRRRGLELTGTKDAVAIDQAITLGRHGGDRRSEAVKDQGDNITLKDRGTSRDYLLARLRRDRKSEAVKDQVDIVNLKTAGGNSRGSS